MLGLAVVAVRAAASYLLVATAIVVAVAALSLIERAGSGTLPVLHGPALSAIIGVAIPTALMVALTFSVPTVRVPLLNFLLAVALVLLTGELLPLDERKAARATDSRGETVAPANLIYRGEDGAQALLAGTELPQRLRRGTTVRPSATLLLPPRATPVSPREPLRHRADVDLQVVTDSLRTTGGEVVAPRTIVQQRPSMSERLPGADAWRAEQLLGDLTTLASAAAAGDTFAGRALTAVAIGLLFFGVRLLLHASYWLAANLLFAVVALRVLPGIIVTASSSAIPDLIGLLPIGIAERLAGHAMAAGAAATGIALLLGELLFAPPPGRSLADLRAIRRGSPPAPARKRRGPRSARQDTAAVVATLSDDGGEDSGALDSGGFSVDDAATDRGSDDLDDLDLTDLSDTPDFSEGVAPEPGNVDLAEIDPADGGAGDVRRESNFGNEEFDINLNDGAGDRPEDEQP